jgi:acyl-CoA synthetase (AMP-forming)/AMP-acid ligase II
MYEQKQRGEQHMQGLMMNRPLMISALLMHAAENHSDTEIVSRLPVGGTHRYTYKDAHRRSRQLVRVLQSLGVKADRPRRHAGLEHPSPFRDLLRVSGMAAICHTINPRLFPEQILHRQPRRRPLRLLRPDLPAADREALAPHCKGVKGWVAMTDEAHMPESSLEPAVLRGTAGGAEGRLRMAGVRREHRVLAVLHLGHHRQPEGRALLAPLDGAARLRRQPARRLGASARDCILPVVPMFHVNAWGLPYACTLTGAKLVMPGPHLDGASLYAMFERRRSPCPPACRPSGSACCNHLQSNRLKLSTVKRLSSAARRRRRP